MKRKKKQPFLDDRRFVPVKKRKGYKGAGEKGIGGEFVFCSTRGFMPKKTKLIICMGVSQNPVPPMTLKKPFKRWYIIFPKGTQ